MKKMIHIVTVLFSGLIAGLLFSYACSVNLGLHHLGDVEYVKAMQGINIEIQNFYFFTVFMGLLFLLPVSAWLSFSSVHKATFYLWLTATIIYLFGVLGITLVGNVPLNNQMAVINLSSVNSETLSAFRHHFESQWTSYHMIRTVASIISFILTIIGVVCGRHHSALQNG
ncbi:MAG: anthrone oxygenase family protein [Saprospiraceae bacterium]